MSVSATESALAHLPAGVTRGHVATSPLPPIPFGHDALDDLLEGGLPRGQLSELYGPASSGRTSFVYALFAHATRRGEIVALVDGGDRFDPRRGEEAGIVLERLLWVRPPRPEATLRACEILLGTRGFAVVVLDLADGIPAELGKRWFFAWTRLAGRVAASRSAFLLLSRERLAGSAASVCISFSRERRRWSGEPPAVLFAGIDARVELVRHRQGATGRRIRVVIPERAA